MTGSEYSGDYSLALGISYFLIAGHLARQIFQALKLPGAVAILITGFAGSYFMQVEIGHARKELQKLAFFLILVRAGTEIDLRAASQVHLLMIIIIPAMLEMTAIAFYAMYMYDWVAQQAFTLGCVLFCLGEGLVVPKICQFAKLFPGHPLIKDMMLWVPLEATLALTVFGILETQIAAGDDVSGGVIAGAVLLQIFCSSFFGLLLGLLVGFLAKIRHTILLPTVGQIPLAVMELHKTVKRRSLQALSPGGAVNNLEPISEVEQEESPTSPHSGESADSAGSGVLRTSTVLALPATSESEEEEIVEYIQRPLFTNCKAEALVMLLGICLVVEGLGEPGGIPLGFLPKTLLFQPELFCILTACGFKYGSGHEVMVEIHHSLDHVWVFGSLVLFSMIGSNTDLSAFSELRSVLPLLAVGAVARFISIVTMRALTLRMRSCCSHCRQVNRKLILADSCFYFVCVFAKASIQGAIGGIPKAKAFWGEDTMASDFIAISSSIAIIFYAVIGCISLELLGPLLLKYTHDVRFKAGSCSCKDAKALKEKDWDAIFSPPADSDVRSSVSKQSIGHGEQDLPTRIRSRTLSEFFEDRRDSLEERILTSISFRTTTSPLLTRTNSKASQHSHPTGTDDTMVVTVPPGAEKMVVLKL
mmetsp:Transcript_68553/g.123532  ORF Transcript_68553/g.123532 Transcript_68553/m.123532 type:complete len:646 (+) Transcript_68553:14-1951(+)|eukprot:CAMPEP_0115080292 /NCGR_PEP_ID=MMETSP0227-20121206/18591_1 /TAXON_ID=89957 /ORGANISM="Polarella glacialis, Strain CCMP 1383" /LENGTH=645 /DNA_ID=CAMNT_0002467907 /DNA_START=81 /DNA_END=2018 /DNA_ORIENTATION=+